MRVTVNQNIVQEGKDIFVQGNLVTYRGRDDESWIVLVSDTKAWDSDYFVGTVIFSSRRPDRVGEYATAWRKKEFVLFEGNVVLEQ